MFAPLDFARSSFLCFFLKKKGKNAPGCHPIRRRERGKSVTSPQRWTGGSWGMVLDGTMHSGACGNAACFDGHRSALHPPLQRAAVSGATIRGQSLCTTDHAHGGCEDTFPHARAHQPPLLPNSQRCAEKDCRPAGMSSGAVSLLFYSRKTGQLA